MQEGKDELDPPFEILEPADWRGPVMFNSPHSGSVYPRAFLAASRLDVSTLRRSEDCFVDELALGVVGRGFPLLRAHFPPGRSERKSKAHAHEPIEPREEPVPSPARPQSGGLATLGQRSVRRSEKAKQADFPLHRVLHLLLVPRDGAAGFREPENRGADEDEAPSSETPGSTDQHNSTGDDVVIRIRR